MDTHRDPATLVSYMPVRPTPQGYAKVCFQFEADLEPWLLQPLSAWTTDPGKVLPFTARCEEVPQLPSLFQGNKDFSPHVILSGNALTVISRCVLHQL